ncbi:hypothetical protein CVO76_02790, partial [Arthrobacter agilis]
MKLLTALPSRRRSALAAVVLTASLALAACGSAEENPLGVNAAGRAGTAEDAATANGGRAVPVGADLGEDPLNVG